MPQNRRVSTPTSETVVFGILLAITCRGNDDNTIEYLRRFANSLVRTSQKSTEIRFRLVVYLNVYHVGDVLPGPVIANPSVKTLENVLFQERVQEVITVLHDQQHPRSSKIWDNCAKKAFSDGCDFMALMSHDAELRDEGWVESVFAAFEQFAASSGAPFGFGCVALRDTTGMPIFPIIHRTHMEIFKGGVVPDISTGEGPEFLFQLYRRFGCSTILSCQVSNLVREVSVQSFNPSLKDWTFETLDKATATAEAWLQDKGSKCERVVTLDVVVPSFRVIISFLRGIVELETSKSCSVMFFIIVDNPDSPRIPELKALYSDRSDVRIRVNEVNLGPSNTRNRGINEAAAEWIHFLDDDIIPRKDLFLNLEKHLRAKPNAVGMAGVTDVPLADTICKAALLISGAVYYFSVADRLPSNIPWSVSANLVVRRNVKDGVRFSTLYPKAGGGEDIDFCLSKVLASKARGGEGFAPAPDVRTVHPWWPEGRRAYKRFYVWSHGDENLSRRFPQYTYLDFVPNSAESLILCFLCGSIALVTARWRIATVALKAALCIVLSNTLCDCFRHLFLHPDRLHNLHTSVRGIRWVMAIVESSFIRLFREFGWFHGMIEHGGFNFLRRFDLNAGRLGTTVIEEERKFRLQKIALSVLCTVVLVYFY